MRIPLLASLTLLVIGCAGGDIDKLCPIADEVMADKSIAPEDRSRVFAAKVDDAVSSSSVKKIFGAIASAAPEQRYRLLQAGAAEVGRPDFKCDAIEKLFTPLPKAVAKKVVEPEAPAPIANSDAAGIQKAIRASRKKTTLCYERELMKDPKLAGKIVVEFTIGAAGNVTSVSASENTLGNDKVAACLTGVIGRLVFEKPAKGEQKVKFPFVFTPGK